MKYVATHKPDSLGRGPVIVEGVRGVKSKGGPDLIVWGSSLTSVLLVQGLIDEVVLIVYPVLLGRKRTFFFGQGHVSRSDGARNASAIQNPT